MAASCIALKRATARSYSRRSLRKAAAEASKTRPQLPQLFSSEYAVESNGNVLRMSPTKAVFREAVELAEWSIRAAPKIMAEKCSEYASRESSLVLKVRTLV